MSDETTNAAAPQEAPEMPINILAQYVRDLSFENPNAPDSLRAAKSPQMDINIGMDARKIPDEEGFVYEVVLNLRAVAMNDEPMFIGELQYGAVVELRGVPEDAHHPILLIEVPRLIFPYARQIMSNLTMQGGFPPLMLSPVDFQALYQERFKDEIAAAREGAKQTIKEDVQKETEKEKK